VTPTPLPVLAPDVDDSFRTVDPVCDVCPHDLERHDTIGRRFCQATLDGALTRGCACRPVAAGV
jgi:hypothetical protein